MEAARKQGKLRVPAVASLWYIATSALQRSIGVLGTPIFTRLLSAEEYGLYPLFNTWLGIITVFATLEISGGISLRGLQKYKGREKEFISSAIGLIGCIFLTICILYITFAEFANRLTGLSTRITLILLLQIFVNAVINLYSQECKYRYNYKNVAVLNILSALGSPLVAVLLIFLTDFRAESRIFASLAVTLCLAVPILIRMVRAERKLIDRGIWSYLLRLAIPLLPHYISMAVILRIGEIVIGRTHGTEALGRYSVALSLGMSLTVITNGLTSALSPWILRKISCGNIQKIRDLLLSVTKGLCLFCLLILSIVPETIQIITPPEYHECLIAVYPLALTAIPMFLSSVISQGQMYYEKGAISSLSSIIAATVSIVLSLSILPHIDYRFVSLFVLFSYITMLLLNTLVFTRISGEIPIHIKESGIVYLLCLVYATLFLLLRDNVILRIILVLPIIPTLRNVGIGIYRDVKEDGAS